MIVTLPWLSYARAVNRVGCQVVLADDLNRLDRLLPDHHVDVVDEDVAAGEPLVQVGALDRDGSPTQDVTFGPPPAHQGAETLDLRAPECCSAGRSRSVRSSSPPCRRCRRLSSLPGREADPRSQRTSTRFPKVDR